jgi:hypothetical protein
MNKVTMRPDSLQYALLGLGMFLVASTVLVASGFFAFGFVLPSLGIDSNLGWKPFDDPVRTLLTMGLVILWGTGALYLGFLLAVALCQAFIDRATLRRQFIEQLRCKPLDNWNGRLFDAVFKKRAEQHGA